jgi:glutamyl-tRNA synthetase
MLDLGLSVVDISISMKSVYSENRKLRDADAPRVFFVRSPVWVDVQDLPDTLSISKVPVHPDFPDRGVREIPTGIEGGEGTFGIQESDLKRIKKGDMFRLKDLANLTLVEKRPSKAVFHSIDVEDVRQVNGPIIHWVPKDGTEKVELTMIDGSVEHGLAEPSIRDLSVGTFLQFERVGFARITEFGDSVKVSFAHK